MGEAVNLEGEEDDITILVKVWQATGSDGDPTDEGPYKIEVVRDTDGIGGQRASILTTIEDIPSNTIHSIPLHVDEAGQYVYLVVTEQNGKDNPEGDGEDISNNDTDELEADGKRDDLNDSA